MGKRGPRPGTGGRPKRTLDACYNDAAHMRGTTPELETLSLIGNKTAAAIYNNTVEWLKSLGCFDETPVHLIEEYALCKARWIECEAELQRGGLSAEHPTTRKPTKSYYADIGMTYLKQADTAYNAILEIIKLKSSAGFAANSDTMEMLLAESAGAK